MTAATALPSAEPSLSERLQDASLQRDSAGRSCARHLANGNVGAAQILAADVTELDAEIARILAAMRGESL